MQPNVDQNRVITRTFFKRIGPFIIFMSIWSYKVKTTGKILSLHDCTTARPSSVLDSLLPKTVCLIASSEPFASLVKKVQKIILYLYGIFAANQQT